MLRKLSFYIVLITFVTMICLVLYFIVPLFFLFWVLVQVSFSKPFVVG
jgi:hypothetical protein